MVWSDGEIFIVELPSPEHGSYFSEFNRIFLYDDIVDEHLQGYMTAFVCTQNPRLEADMSYGPLARPLPAGLQEYWQRHTLKVEIGFYRRWGNAIGQLDWRANRWTTFVGVRYVLCVAVWPNLTRAEYKLYPVHGLDIALPDQDPNPVAAPATLVAFDARVLLGLQPRVALPRGFPDPLTIDLFQSVTSSSTWPPLVLIVKRFISKF